MPNPYVDAVTREVEVEKSPLELELEKGVLSEALIEELLKAQNELKTAKKLEKTIKSTKELIKRYRNQDGVFQVGRAGVITVSTRNVERLDQSMIKEALGVEDLSEYKSISEEKRVDIKPIET